MSRILLTLVGVVLIAGQSHAADPCDWDIYSDAVIQEGDEYGYVRVFDTPPVQTTLNMTGGYVDWLNTYDSSVTNVYDGTLFIVQTYGTSIVNVFGGTISPLEVYDSSTAHIHGGVLDYHLVVSETASAHIYGSDFAFQPSGSGPRDGWLSGYWEDNSPFNIWLRNLPEPFPSAQLVLHEIPEPSILAFLSLGGLGLRRRAFRS